MNARLKIVHAEKQKGLFMKKVEILGEFMGSYRLSGAYIDQRTGKSYPSYRGDSFAHKEFTDIHKELYLENKKTITKEYLNKITSPIALAYWFMDDGSNCGTIATNSFSEKEVDTLIEWMDEKWDIKCSKQRNKQYFVIHILSKSRPKFDYLIKPYIVDCMAYKLKY